MDLIVAADLLSPNFGLVIWVALAFGIVLFILSKFAWGPITSALDEREHRIEDSLSRAEIALAEARQLQENNEAARREAEQERQRILRQARDESERLRTEELEKTRAVIQRERELAQDEINRSKQQAIQDLRTEVADMAVEAAERILDQKFSDHEQQRQMVERFIADLPRN
jgi:F-type H+-transporting ATPase subunit b